MLFGRHIPLSLPVRTSLLVVTGHDKMEQPAGHVVYSDP